MPGTHTPTQTWHATGTYVLTGEVITESVAKEVGTFAMDNVARLVGTAAGATPQAIRRIATVADLAALKAIAAADRADQDYVAIDTANGERLYKFDSAGAGTGDDFSIITPDAGTGRWHFVNAKPKSTVRRWVVSALATIPDIVSATAVRDFANGRVDVSNATTAVYSAQFGPFNAGDVITEIEVCGQTDPGVGVTATISAAFKKIEADDGDVVPTVTALGTVTVAANQPATATQSAAAPLPITIPEGADHDSIVVEITVTAPGAIDQAYFYWVALNGTRSFITE